MKRVLIAAPVRQTPEILQEYLSSLDRLVCEDVRLDFCFVDDNLLEESSDLLRDFSARHSDTTIITGSRQGAGDYARGAVTHQWSEEAIWRVAGYKDDLLAHARTCCYDYVFLVDSDLVLHPRTLSQLLHASRDIVSEIFWTRWRPDAPELPQVWVSGQYDLVERDRGERLTTEQIRRRTEAFLAKLRTPGLYRVGGLGACTLISRSAIERGVSFREIPSLSLCGEDRHFCVRAQALGLELWVDTHYPALHVYRTTELKAVRSYRRASNSEATLLGAAALALRLHGDHREADEKDAEALLCPDLLDHIRRVRQTAAVPQCDSTELAISRLDIVSVDAKGGNALVAAWVANRGVERGLQFAEDALAHVRLLWQKERWVVHSVSFIPLPPPPTLESTEPTVHTRDVLQTWRPRLVLAMIVGNEGQPFLPDVLREARQYIDAAVIIINDGSADAAALACRQELEGIPLILHVNVEPEQRGGHALRKALWDLATSVTPEWILILEANEVFGQRARRELRGLLEAPDVYYYTFPVCDVTGGQRSRADEWPSAATTYRPLMVRFIPDLRHEWAENSQGCSALPESITDLKGRRSGLHVKRLGGATSPAGRINGADRALADTGGTVPRARLTTE